MNVRDGVSTREIMKFDVEFLKDIEYPFLLSIDKDAIRNAYGNCKDFDDKIDGIDYGIGSLVFINEVTEERICFYMYEYDSLMGRVERPIGGTLKLEINQFGHILPFELWGSQSRKLLEFIKATPEFFKDYVKLIPFKLEDDMHPIVNRPIDIIASKTTYCFDCSKFEHFIHSPCCIKCIGENEKGDPEIKFSKVAILETVQGHTLTFNGSTPIFVNDVVNMNETLTIEKLVPTMNIERSES